MLFIEIFFIIAGIGLLCLAFWMGKQREPGGETRIQTPVPSTASINHALKLQNSLNELLHELQGLSQEITDDLEQKLSQLKDLLQLTDKRCEELSSAGHGNGGAAGKSDARNKESLVIPHPPVSELQVTVEDDEAPPTPSARYREIYQLADEGLSLDEIARHVRMGKGEIQLILSLRRKD